MKRPGSLRSRSAPVRHTPIRSGHIKRKKRAPSEFARIYGSKARVAYIKGMMCSWCTKGGPCENAHTETDGMGRKAGYETIVPPCPNCHRAYDEHRPPFHHPVSRKMMRDYAPLIDAAWQSHLRQTGRARREETGNNG